METEHKSGENGLLLVGHEHTSDEISLTVLVGSGHTDEQNEYMLVGARDTKVIIMN